MNRDDSTEEKTEVDANFKLPNSADVSIQKRMGITKAAKRFERYGHVEDGQNLVSLIGDIAPAVEGRETHVVSERHRKKAEEAAARAIEQADTASDGVDVTE